jgi:hypothetical protein
MLTDAAQDGEKSAQTRTQTPRAGNAVACVSGPFSRCCDAAANARDEPGSPAMPLVCVLGADDGEHVAAGSGRSIAERWATRLVQALAVRAVRSRHDD